MLLATVKLDVVKPLQYRPPPYARPDADDAVFRLIVQFINLKLDVSLQ
jgi:hypothetical protein